jgi:hypothetical protein
MFPNATRVRSVPCTKASLEALQEIRIKYRWQAIDQEMKPWKKRNSKKRFKPILLANHDTVKQLLARSRYFYTKTNQSGLKPNSPSRNII